MPSSVSFGEVCEFSVEGIVERGGSGACSSGEGAEIWLASMRNPRSAVKLASRLARSRSAWAWSVCMAASKGDDRNDIGQSLHTRRVTYRCEARSTSQPQPVATGSNEHDADEGAPGCESRRDRDDGASSEDEYVKDGRELTRERRPREERLVAESALAFLLIERREVDSHRSTSNPPVAGLRRSHMHSAAPSTRSHRASTSIPAVSALLSTGRTFTATRTTERAVSPGRRAAASRDDRRRGAAARIRR